MLLQSTYHSLELLVKTTYVSDLNKNSQFSSEVTLHYEDPGTLTV